MFKYQNTISNLHKKPRSRIRTAKSKTRSRITLPNEVNQKLKLIIKKLNTKESSVPPIEFRSKFFNRQRGSKKDKLVMKHGSVLKLIKAKKLKPPSSPLWQEFYQLGQCTPVTPNLIMDKAKYKYT